MKNLVKMPESKFVQVVCSKCKNQQVVFSKASTVVNCRVCGEELVSPTGGVAQIKGKVLRTLG